MDIQKKVFVLVGPSGVGKDTLMNKLIERYPNSFKKATTHTTRAIRPGEVEGVNYYYVTKPQFEEMIKKDQFVEHNFYNNNYYGSSKAELESAGKHSKILFLVIDINGAKNVHKQNIPANYIGVLPPSMDVLEKRLASRGTESKEVMQGRIDIAKEEYKQINESPFFNYRIINDDLDKATDEFESEMKILYPNLNK